MFDDIDFLDPNAAKDKPRKRAVSASEIEMVIPQEKKRTQAAGENQHDDAQTIKESVPTISEETSPTPSRIKLGTGSYEGGAVPGRPNQSKVPSLIRRGWGGFLKLFAHKSSQKRDDIPKKSDKPPAIISDIRPVDALLAQTLLTDHHGEAGEPAFPASPAPPQAKQSEQALPPREKDTNIPEVNLLPDHEHVRRAVKVKPWWIAAAGAVAVVGLIALTVWYGYLTQLVERSAVLIREDIQQAEQELGDIKPSIEEAVELVGRLQALESILGRHTRWGQFLSWLEESTSPRVYYASVKATVEGEMSLKVHAKTWRDAAEQIAALRANPRVREVRVAALEGDVDTEGKEKEVTFDINLVIDPAVIMPGTTE